MLLASGKRLEKSGGKYKREMRAFSAFLFTSSIVLLFMTETNAIDGKKLSRRKRYVAFPEGSTLSIAICMTAQAITRPSELFTEGLNWGLSYDLPNNTATIKEFLYPRHVMQRRHRRDLYQKLEVIMNSMGYDGKTCIYRALCEAGAMFSSKGSNVIEEILRIIFGFPQQRILPSEPEEHREYQRAHRVGKEAAAVGGQQEDECSSRFPGCSFSLLDMALGHYGDSGLPFAM